MILAQRFEQIAHRGAGFASNALETTSRTSGERRLTAATFSNEAFIDFW
jgi:hypothetical protein